MGVGVIVRDGEGEVVAALHASQMHLLDPTSMEAYAVWKAIQLGRDLGLPRVMLEGDALTIVHALQTADHSWQLFGNLIEASKSSMCHFQSSSMMHTKREANMEAHLMVKAALQTHEQKIWIEEYLAFLRDIVISYQCTN
jgi:ribonuclease HI